MNDTLPSWHDTSTKQAILDFVAAVTDEASPQYVPPAERIAVFDNDGTLWCEKPQSRGWTAISMQRDWRQVFPGSKGAP